jgi:hypothetical protein
LCCSEESGSSLILQRWFDNIKKESVVSFQIKPDTDN